MLIYIIFLNLTLIILISSNIYAIDINDNDGNIIKFLLFLFNKLSFYLNITNIQWRIVTRIKEKNEANIYQIKTIIQTIIKNM